jgi:inorganic pyrophosphatase
MSSLALKTDLCRLDAFDPDTRTLNVIIDTPKGCRNKYKYDEDRALFQLSKMLPLGATFPFNFGFIPSTKGEGGDSLDVLVLMDEPVFVGCLVPARLIGVIEAEQTENGQTIRNDRLIALPETPYNAPVVQSLKDLPKAQVDDIEHFFISYNKGEGREFKPVGRFGPRRALQLIEEGARRFRQEEGIE